MKTVRRIITLRCWALEGLDADDVVDIIQRHGCDSVSLSLDWSEENNVPWRIVVNVEFAGKKGAE